MAGKVIDAMRSIVERAAEEERREPGAGLAFVTTRVELWAAKIRYTRMQADELKSIANR
jgi:hypothetical protein